jgi:hypothetical protein
MKTIYLATAYSYKSFLSKIPTNPPSKFDLIGRFMMWLRNKRVSKCAAFILKNGNNVFSPITHSHYIARTGKLPQLSHSFWLKLDKWYVDACDEVWVYNQKGWKESYGVKREIEWALEDNKSVYLVNKYGRVLRQILN